jgi:hypothetical protein
MEKLHWKKLHNYDYLGAYSLEQGQDVTLTIKEVKSEMVKGTSGREEKCMVVYFQEEDKPMIFNRTNSKTVAQVHGTPYVDEWVGKQIVVGIEKVNAFGETTDALRVRHFAPQAKVNVTDAITTLSKAKDLKELKQLWTSLTSSEQNHKEVIAKKDELKGELG